MKKRTKKMNIAEEKNTVENELIEKIDKITKDLYYTSETDEEIHSFLGEKVQAITPEEILKANNSSTNTPIEEGDAAKLFDGLTTLQDWYGDEEKATAEKFAELKELLETNLKDLKFYKVGTTEIDIYVVGLDSENFIVGIKTKSVET